VYLPLRRETEGVSGTLGIDKICNLLVLDNYLDLDIYYLYLDSNDISMDTQAFEQERLIKEDTYIQPLKEVLDEITPKSMDITNKSLSESSSFKESLDNLFPEQKYQENDIQEARKILRDTAVEFSEDQLKESINEAKFLVETWLDDFEREIFEGLTLQELLHEKGGA